MRYTLSFFVLMLFAATAVQAVDDFGFICEKPGAEKRQIHIAYQNPNSRLPCEVRYFKGDRMQVLWSSINTAGYCASKAREFADKQTAWGWQCHEVMYVDDASGAATSASE